MKKYLLATLLIINLIMLMNSSFKVSALSGSDWQAGRIIDDAIFTDKNSMSVDDIQRFLGSKVSGGSCDNFGTRGSGVYSATLKRYLTNAEYGAQTGNPAPYTCVYQYVENPTNGENNFVDFRRNISGGISAAQIIKNAADKYNISPKVLLVTMQKEQALVSDHNPWLKQYQKAMGASCPDTAPCDPTKAGFFNQVNTSASHFRRYMDRPFLYFVGWNNILWNVSTTGCGAGPVYIENRATAALYHYTPYQPNAAALANLSGTGDRCSTYGNRNFWRIFNTWFGRTQTEDYFYNLSYSADKDLAALKQDQTATIDVTVNNTGNMTWDLSTNPLLLKSGSSLGAIKTANWVDDFTPLKVSSGTVAPKASLRISFEVSAPAFGSNLPIVLNLVDSLGRQYQGNSLAASVGTVLPTGSIGFGRDSVNIVGTNETNTFNFTITNNTDTNWKKAGENPVVITFNDEDIQLNNDLLVGQSHTFGRVVTAPASESQLNFTVNVKLGDHDLGVVGATPLRVATTTDQSIAGNSARTNSNYIGTLAADPAIYDKMLRQFQISGVVNPVIPTLATSANERILTVDFDGDGIVETGLYQPSSGKIQLLNSSGVVVYENSLPAGRASLVPYFGNYKGDAKMELVFWDTSSRSYRLLENGQYQEFKISEAANQVPLPADHDGDGLIDMNTYSKDNLSFNIRQSSNPAIFVRTLGTATDIPIMYDNDGDKKSDPGVFRPTTNQFIFWRQSGVTRTYGFAPISATQQIAVADYDGDLRADVGMFDPVTNTFKYIRTVNGVTVTKIFGTNQNTMEVNLSQ